MFQAIAKGALHIAVKSIQHNDIVLRKACLYFGRVRIRTSQVSYRCARFFKVTRLINPQIRVTVC